MKEIISTITSKGQVTIPAEIRRLLGVGTNDKISFVIGDEGEVHLKPPRFSTIESLRGAAVSGGAVCTGDGRIKCGPLGEDG